jgi:hypothetical protein
MTIGECRYNYSANLGWGEFETEVEAGDIFEASLIAIERYKDYKLKDPEWKEQHGTDLSMRIWRINKAK